MRDQLRKLMAEVFSVPEKKIPDDAAFNHLDGWDSLGHITLMLAVEQEFQVELSTEAMLNALSLPAIEDFLQEAMQIKESKAMA